MSDYNMENQCLLTLSRRLVGGTIIYLRPYEQPRNIKTITDIKEDESIKKLKITMRDETGLFFLQYLT